ncbi:MAG: M48 family metalloprotease [Pseudomonadota bacterium]
MPFRILVWLSALIVSQLFWAAALQAEELPRLGDSTSSVVSPEQEYRLGRAWLRQLRAQAPIIQDPLIHEYFYDLVYRLAANSEIQRPELETIVLNSPDINAFAVPGGIIGLNGGLLLNARTEDELAGVIAHELAHLSQRHFARAMERSQNTSWAGLAALLASVVIAATAGGDAGMAALATTQAASIESQLRFSRNNEQEADRIGMQTLARSGMNPGAMADFFEALQRSMRYSGELPPEFLLTHPVTESRITDARARAAQLPATPASNSLEFGLMKMRTSVMFARDTSATINDLLNQRKSGTEFLEVNEYGLACAYSKANQLDQALATINGLLLRRPDRITYIATKAEILNQSGRYKDAIQLLESALKYSPENYVLTIHYANALIKSNRAADAVDLLRYQLTQHDSWPLLWSMLAEAYGKSDDRLGVYQARAEYYYLHGRTMTALEQLQYALPLAEKQFQVAAKINARMEEMRASELDMRL